MKVVVVGGVAAGMSAAARVRRLDESAEIVVFERGPHVSFANCGLPYHVGGVIAERDNLLLHTPRSLGSILNLDVRTGVEVRSIQVAEKSVTVVEQASGREYREPYDKLVLAPGAQPVRPPIPGSEDARVHVLRSVTDMDQIKQLVDRGARRALVIGGGYVGVEMAENLQVRGVEVTLVDLADQIIPPLDKEMARDLETHLVKHGLRIHLGVSVKAFSGTAEELTAVLSDGRSLATDLVVMAIGVRPDVSLARAAGIELGPRGGIRVDRHLRTSVPDIFAAGDAVEVVDKVTGEPALIPLAGPANRQGRIVGDNLCGLSSAYTATQGSSVVKVFEMTAGGTGATEKALLRSKRPYRKIYLHPLGHAGYYPGSRPLHMKVLFDPGSGSLLGAQVVGFDGVDKRIDVLATALRAGMTVEDLQHLELAYAPPYGSAKDPVNMAGFIASNLQRGGLHLWYAEDYPDKTGAGVLLDVRTPQEFARWHIPGAVNMPLGTLRANLSSLPAGRPVFVYCRVGFRSYLAYRILCQSGVNPVSMLAGGSLTFGSVHGIDVG